MISVSFITPLYHGQKYIDGLVELVSQNVMRCQQQGYDLHAEMILVNDSPDDPVSLPSIKKFKITLLVHEKNTGIHGARITGLRYATGDYVIFLDQDDEISPDFLSQMLQKIGKHDVIVSNAWLEHDDGTRSLRYDNQYSFRKVSMLEVYCRSYNQIVSPGQCLIRRNAIPEEWMGYTTRINGSDDLLLWVLMLSANKSFSICEDALYTHKYTGANLSNEADKMSQSTLEIVDYLETIPYVQSKVVKDMRRSRSLSLAWGTSDKKDRIMLILSNIDILLCRAYWKLRSEMRKKDKYESHP